MSYKSLQNTNFLVSYVIVSHCGARNWCNFVQYYRCTFCIL